MARIVAYVPDMIFASKIKGARAAGADVQVVAALPSFLVAIAQPGVVRAIIDLGAADALAAVAAASGAGVQRVIAFVSHVDAARAAAARDAGAGEVMARSAFVAALPALLAQ